MDIRAVFPTYAIDLSSHALRDAVLARHVAPPGTRTDVSNLQVEWPHIVYQIEYSAEACSPVAPPQASPPPVAPAPPHPCNIAPVLSAQLSTVYSAEYPPSAMHDGDLSTISASQWRQHNWASVQLHPRTFVGDVLVYNRIDSADYQAWHAPSESLFASLQG